MRAQLQGVADRHGYTDILLVDLTGKILVGLSPASFRHDSFRSGLSTAFRTFEPVYLDLHSEAGNMPPHIAFIVPLITVSGQVKTAYAALVLVRNAARDLYPLLEFSLPSSPSAEIILVRRQDQEVLFLSELRGRKEAALRLRIPLTRQDCPAVAAALGRQGYFEGVDYRGKKVVSSLAAVPDSSWFLITKVDSHEALQLWRLNTILMIVLLFLLLAMLLSSALTLWQRDRKRHFEKLYTTEVELRSQIERHSFILKSIGDAVIVTDQAGRVELINATAEQLTGWQENQAIGKPIDEVFCLRREEMQSHDTMLLQTRQGPDLPISCRFTPVVDGNGQAVAVVIVFQDRTNEWEARRQLQRSEERFRSTLDGMMEGCQILAKDWTYIYLNRAAIRQANLDGQELVGRNFLAVWPGIEKTELFARMQACLNDQQPVCMENLFRYPDGSQGWFDLAMYPVPEGIFILSMDITQRKRTTEELKREKHIMQLFIERAPAAIAMFDKEMRYIAVSQRFLSDYRIENRNIVGHSHYEIFPETSAESKAIHRRCLAGATERGAQDPFLRANGETDWIRWEICPWYEMNDEIGGVILFSELITEQKRAVEKLQESEEKFRKLFQKHSAVKLIIDPDSGRIVEANEAAERFYGWSVEQLCRMNISEINTLPLPEVQDRMKDASKDHNHLFKFQHRLADGCLKDVEVYSSSIDINGTPMLHSIVHDISDQTRAEKEKARLQAQLIQAQKMESVGLLAGGIAHDFNNMLSVILGYTELARQNLPGEHPLSFNLEQIGNAAQRSKEITRQLLAFARKQNIQPQELDLNATLSGTLSLLKRLIGEDIELVWLPGNGLWTVLIDPSQLDQIMANLCVNARDAISGVGRISIATQNLTLDAEYCSAHYGFVAGDFVQVSVSDNGCGMDKETVGHLFEPFFTTKVLGNGTGLGLATVYGIIKQNNGFINVYSEPGHGSTFSLYFPRVKQTAPTERRSDVTGIRPGQGETILIVEDEASIRTMTQKMLERMNYRVLACESPSEALQLTQAHPDRIDLLLTDVIMPEMNGLELAGKVAEIRKNIKTLFLSGYTANIIAHRGIIDDGIHFLQKPFSLQELAGKVATALGKG